MAVGVAVAGLAITAASTAYSVQQAEQAKNHPQLPDPVKEPELPTAAKTGNYSADVAKSQLLAASAGGTILSDKKKNAQAADTIGGPPADTPVGTDPAAPRKSLLGS